MASAMWDTIAKERAALADDLERLTAEQWDPPSLCDKGSVRDVVAHMTASARIGVPTFFGKMLASGFSFGRMQTKDIRAQRGTSPADTLARFRAEVSSTKHPPGPTTSWLGEALIHAEDVRRPLGIAHTYPLDAAAQVADFYKGSNLIVGAKKRVAGLRLRATDTDWSHGDGPEVAGPVMSLVMSMTGRTPALDDLEGEGVATLRSRG